MNTRLWRLTAGALETAQSWGDVYYFCGPDLRFCTCDFRWNLAGWGKALVLWNFVLSSALGLQKLAIRLGLDGLLPGPA
jgi:hypothetical protein